MTQYRHILLDGLGEALNYTNPSRGGGEFRPPQRNRTTHARKLISDVSQARDAAEALAGSTGHVIRDICLEIVGKQGYELKTESFDSRRGEQVSAELLSVRERDNTQYATVYVPEGKLGNFLRKIERYEKEDTKPSKAYPTGRPKNEDMVAGIDSIRFPVLRSFWNDDEDLYPTSETETIWWEVWTRVGPTETHDEAFTAFVETVAGSQLKVSPHCSKFPERLVFLAFGSQEQWIRAFVPLLDRLAELRRAKELPTEFLRLDDIDQREFVEDLAQRLTLPALDAPAVCLLDHGVHIAHPLLRPFIGDEDAQALNPDWPIVDHAQAHGTEMAGLTIFGDNLPGMLADNNQHTLHHRLESVRMLHSAQPHNQDVWGSVTKASLALAEIQAPFRPRVACLPITAIDMGRDHGRPTEWSAAVDQHASGQLDEDDQRRLYVAAAGNIRNIATDSTYTYPDSNLSDLSLNGIEDPGQSWNALTVGAFTNRVQLQSPDLAGHQPVAPRGGICPSSRTSRAWNDDTWPLKPDIVMEGGNYSRSPGGQIDGCDDLSLLTTSMTPAGRLFTLMGDTSAATALAARSAAIIMADYPKLWPETVRGLLVHSADWTKEMRHQVPGNLQRDHHKRLRCFGYGVPDMDRARHTVENCVSLVHQGMIQPFKLDGTTAKTNHFVLHSLPWPQAALEALHDKDVTVRITLSYFIEPSPGGRGRGTKFRYASHGLRFALRGPDETETKFRRRISSQEWEEEQDRPSTSDPINWTIGKDLRTHGSIHSDWVKASAAEIARCGQVAVSPVTGWWKERKHLDCVEKQARYSLVITISTEETEVDLYTPIAQEIDLITEIET
jgi:hypothetical protein